MLPDSPSTTYVPGSLPAVKSADLNDLQKWTAENWQVIRGMSCWIHDDFTGDSIDRGTWLNSAAATFADDSAQGAWGALSLSTASTTLAMQAQKLAAGSSDDLWLTTRIRASSIGGSGSFIGVGLVQDPTAALLGTSENWLAVTYAPVGFGQNGNWWLWYGAGKVSGAPFPTQVDTGVAAGAAYQRIDIVRLAGQLLVFINGAQVATASPAPFTLAGMAPFLAVSRVTSGTSTAFLDKIALWARTSR